jgi:GTP-binding protein HflX
MSQGQDPLDLDIDQLLRESARAAAEFDHSELDESKQQDLQDRQALRRVSGLSTELQDVNDAEYRQLRLEKVVLVGVWTQGTSQDAENSMKELAALAQTAGSEVMEGFVQRRDKPDASTFIGSGKVEEVKQSVIATGADTVVCDGELSPAQLRTLESKLKVKVIDRTALILDIFAQHAKSREGKAQVELAQMSYMLPRLRGWGDSLSRQAGGIGGRGPGETKIETDRRRINDKMAKLRKEIIEMKDSVPSVAITGYTNAGKSSLMNKLTNAGVLVENALFVTLDPTVRQTKSSDGRIYTLTDTVGFVRHLPHQLIEAFKSTLEEVAAADLIVHVVDGSHPDPREQIRAVREVIKDVGGGDIPEIIAINKADIAAPEVIMQILREESNSFAFSARTGFGMETLVKAIETSLPRPRIEVRAVIPFSRGDLVSIIHERGEVLSETYSGDGTRIHALVDSHIAKRINELIEVGEIKK